MVIAPSIPVVQNLRQSLLSPSYIDTWLQENEDHVKLQTKTLHIIIIFFNLH